ncbi:MAG: AAA family ATPase [Rhodocyclaceae bacterium]
MNEHAPAARTAISASLTEQVWQFSELVLRTRFAQALEEGVARYPVYRNLRYAARIALEEHFDAVALTLGWRAQRIDANSMLLDGDGLLIVAYGGRKSDYCSCHFSIWAGTPQIAEAAKEAILALAGDSRVLEPMFSIDWHFLTSKGELESASIEELADDVLLDEAYPELMGAGGVNAFIQRYLDARETVLVLQGPPGTGKTRLIRAILGEISRRRGGEAQALYTGDKKALESDQIFVKFITGWDDAFVVEDADHLLKPRSEGNEHLHRFLTIADGVVRSQGRKIIFSTNLPNVGDLDDALIRPGRCFARVHVRQLVDAEIETLVARLTGEDAFRSGVALSALRSNARPHHSLAEIYKAVEMATGG